MSWSFLHAADLHLDSPMRGLQRYEGAPVEMLRGAARAAWVRLVDLALDQRVALVVLAGDLYDGDWRDYQTGLFFVQQLQRLSDAGIRTAIIAGNHDAASTMTKSLRWPPGVHMFSTTAETLILEDLGLALHGQSFASRAVTDNLAAGYPAPRPGLLNVGVLHTSLDGRAGHAPYAPCSVDQLQRKGYAYWALGHVHQREQIDGESCLVFPGNLQGRHVRESGAKGCTLVRVGGEGIVSVEHQPVDVLRWQVCHLDGRGMGDADAVFDALQTSLRHQLAAQAGRPMAVRVELTVPASLRNGGWGSTERWGAEARSLGNRVGNGQIWIEKVVVESACEAAVADQRALTDIAVMVQQQVDEGIREEDLPAELAALRQKLPSELWQHENDDFFSPAALQAQFAAAALLLRQRLL